MARSAKVVVCRRGGIAEPRPSTGGREGCPDRSSRRPGPQPASPRGRLPDGGRFLLSRLTARLNIAAGARGRKEAQAGGAAAEPEEGEEEQAEEGRSRISAAPARPAPALLPSPPDAAWRAQRALPAHPAGAPRSRPGCPDGSGWSQETSKRRRGPVRGMHRALPERARAPQDLGTLPGRFARPGPLAAPGRAGDAALGPARPALSIPVPPAPCSPRNGHGAAGVRRCWASRAFAERGGRGSPRSSQTGKPRARDSAKPGRSPRPSLPCPGHPGSQRSRTCPPRDSVGAGPSHRGERQWGRRQGRGRTTRERSRRGWAPSALGLEAPEADLGGIL